VTERLSSRTKFLYGIGDTGFSLTTTIVGTYFAIFLTDVVGLSPKIAALAILIGGSWDYLNDPLVGHLTDRTRTRWGRRRPYLLFGAIPFALAFAFLWWRPPLAASEQLVWYYALAYVVFDGAATFAYMPYFALTPELTDDYDERTALTSYRMFFSIVGSLIAFTLPAMIVGAFRPENLERVFLMGAIFAVASMLPLWLTFAGTRERPAFAHQKQPSLRESIRAARRNRPFIFSAVIFLFTWICMTILQGTLVFFIKYVVQREDQTELIMASIFVTAILVLPLWEWVSRNTDKRKAYITGIAFWAVVQLVLATLTPSTPISLLLGLCVMAGIGVSAAHILPWSMIPDAIEWDELNSGQRHEGMFYSLVTLAQKAASSVAMPTVLLILEATGYEPNAATQPAEALAGIRVAAGPIPAVLLLIGIVFAWRYPLSRRQHKEIVDKLELRRDEAAL
jgi:GPH family glycoside/pentoside/hexuronide:cation symporter